MISLNQKIKRLAASLVLPCLVLALLGVFVTPKGVAQPDTWPSLPIPSWNTTASVVRIKDGDTLIVEVKKTFDVRLLDCWAPETRRAKSPEEKQAGYRAKDFTTNLLDASPTESGFQPGKVVILSVPTDSNGSVAKSWSMGRVLGHIFIPGDKYPISKTIVEHGHATRNKQR